MSNTNHQELGLMPKLVIALAVMLIVSGVLWHGVTLAVIGRIWRNLFERSSGPLSFRFILQPSMAAIAAILDGMKATRNRSGPQLPTAGRHLIARVALVRDGVNATARIILLGLAMDLIYQLMVFQTFHPVEALIIAVMLGFVPYLLVRGLFTPIARRYVSS